MSLLTRAYSIALKRYPLVVQSVQAGLLMGAGDLASQSLVERKSWEQYKWQRTVRFFALGTVFVGPTLTVWYKILHNKFGAGSGLVALKKVAVDQLAFAPLLLGSLLVVLSILDGNSMEATKENIKRMYMDIIITNWTVWPAVQICNFSIVPLHHQVLVVQTFALLWNTYLAWKTNQEPAPLQEKKLDNK